jgi:hypothetical protein
VAHAQDINQILQRYVDIPCPSGKHPRSLVTFRNHNVAAMLCIPCEVAWIETSKNLEMKDVGLERRRD